MRRAIIAGAIGVAMAGALQAGIVEPGRTGRLVPVKFSDVTIEDGFWTPRQETNRRVSIPHNLDTCEKTGRIRNFAQAAGLDGTAFGGHIFHDSDVYKVLEGVAYSLATHPDRELEARLDRIIDLIAKSQQPDGYVNTYFTVKEPQRRWADLRGAHELYCAGHMFEAAVAHFHATGKRTFLDVACRFADYIDSVFGEGKRHAVPGHEEIELALVKIWRATGEPRYLDLARFFVDEHGRAQTHKLYGEYCQDHKPIHEQTEPVGHAVRWLYLFSAVADLAALDGDRGHIDAMERLWQNIVTKKMYLTGGVGVQHHGEGFAREYFLPNHDAYCETCASIGMAFWNQRLALLHGEGRFADLVERVLYNGALAGVSLDGARFFYVNPLASRGDHHRRPWYGCACCPTNVVRYVAALGDYVYAGLAGGEGACVLQYVGGSAVIPLKDGEVRLTQRTRYPWEGEVRIGVEPRGVREFAVSVRVPGWCEGATVTLNGRPLEARPRDGFVTVRRRWRAGDTIRLDLPMPVRRAAAHPKVEANVGRLAVMRGPLVYCLEDCDNPCHVSEIAIAAESELKARFEPDLLGGVVAIRGRGVHKGFVETDDGFRSESRPVELAAIPYYAWDNREPGRMVVWVPTEPPARPEPEGATVAVVAKASASHCWRADTVTALNENILPGSSIDHDVPRFTWWDHRGTTEWAAYEFRKPKRLSRAEVYWFDDTGRGACRVPKSWRDGERWRPVVALNDGAASPYGVERDRFNVVAFEPVTARAIRIEVELREGFSGGILEWRLP